MPKSDFNKVAMTLWHGCSPVNLLHIFRTPFTKKPFLPDSCNTNNKNDNPNINILMSENIRQKKQKSWNISMHIFV